MEHAIYSAARFALDIGLKATILLALALALLLALRRFSAAGRHMVATLALAGVIALPIMTLWTPRVAVPVLPSPEPVVAVGGSAIAVGSGIAADSARASLEEDSRGSDPSEAESKPPAAASVEGAESAEPDDAPAASMAPPALSASMNPSAPSIDVPSPPAAVPASLSQRPAATWPLRLDWAAALLAVWAAGAVVSLARLLFGSWKIRAIARSAEPLCDREWRSAARELAGRLSVPGRVRLVTSPDVAVAMTAGVRRPVLLLHEGARKWAADRRRVVLLHELAHVRRRDWVTFLLAELAVAIYWFHPLAWLARREARTSAERACDDLVLENGTKPSVYAAHLLGIVRSLKPGVGGALPVLAMARPSQFEGRMRAILNPGLQRRGPSRGQLRGAALGLFSAVFLLGTLQPWANATAGAVPAGLGAVEDQIASTHDRPSPSDAPAAQTSQTSQTSQTKQTRVSKKTKTGSWETTTITTSTTTKKPCPGKSAHPPAPAEPAHAATQAAYVSPAIAPLPASDPVPAAPSSGVVSALTNFVRALSKPADAAAPAVKAPAPAPRGIVLAGKGRHNTGGDWYSRGMDLHHDEQYDEAIAAFQKSIEEGYREEASTYNIACGYALKGDKDRAFEWLRKANEVGFPVAKYLTDDDLDSLHSDPRWAALRKELRENPSSEARAEKRHANERYQKLLTDSKARPSRYFEMGKALYNAEEYAASAKAYHRSAELGYRGGTSSYNEACSLSLNGDKAAALDALQRAIENGFDQPDMFRKDDDLDNVRGERRFKELQALAEELEGPSLSWGGHILKSEERHEWKKAADHARQVAAKYPQYGRAWYNLGFAEIKGEHPEAAAPAFLKALELGYRKSTTLYNLACSYSLMGQKDQAFDYLFKAVDAGFDENHTLRHDDDLDNLRGDPRYRQALRRVESKDEGTEEN